MNHNHNHGDMAMNMDTTTIPAAAGGNGAMASSSSTNMPMYDMNHAANMMMSQMVMHLGIIETIVFPEWATKDLKVFVGSCIGLALIGIIYEALKFARTKISIIKRLRNNKQAGSYDVSISDKESQIASNADSDSNGIDIKLNKQTKRASYLSKMFSIEHILQTVFHFFQYTISFFLMLAFMTYNYWICLSILVGITIGYFLFGVTRSLNQDFDDCCD